MNRLRQEQKEQKLRGEERQDALENRQSLLRTAERLFTERGIDAVTMTDIAREAGFGQGTLYRHFAHKGKLLNALLLPHFQRFQEQAMSNFGYDEEATNPLQVLHLFLTKYVDFIEEHTVYLQAFYTAYQAQGGFEWYQCAAHQWNKERTAYYLQQAITVGACRTDLDSAYIADALLATVQVDLYLYERHVLGWSVERIVSGLAQVVGGLAQHPFHPLV